MTNVSSINDIKDSFAKGKNAEEIVAAWIVKQGWGAVKDVRKDKEYQAKDIDYIVSDEESDTPIDVKSDKYYETNNYFIETMSNIELNKIGWGYSSLADFIFIYYPDGDELHVINMFALRPWLIRNAGKCKEKTNATKSKWNNKVLYHSQGILVNRQKLMREIGADNIDVFTNIKGLNEVA